MNLEMDRSEIPDHLLEFFEPVSALPAKSLLMIPFRVAIALQADGWILRSVIPWLKRNSMPESANDRPSVSVEYLFLFSKRARYYWDAEAIKQAAVLGYRHNPNDVPRTGRQAQSSAIWRNAGDAREAVERGRNQTGSTYDTSSGRNFRNSDLFFKTWQGLMLDDAGDPLALVVNPKPNPLPHFASFPDTLVDPFIRAGTSEKGACPACGAPWRRVVERTLATSGRQPGASEYSRRDPRFARGGAFTGNSADTLGWEPGCSCDAGEPIAQTVLDPFLGSGTTLLVASRLGRDGVGIELSPDYARMAEDRIRRDVGPMFPDEVQVGSLRQLSLADAVTLGEVAG